MKKRIKLVLLLAALAASGMAMAADHGDRGKPMHHRGGPDMGMHNRGGPDMGMQVIEHLKRALRRLDLSDEQRDAIRSNMSGMREDLRPLVKQIHEGRRELHEIISSGEYDPEAAAVIASQQGELTEELTMLISGMAASVLAELSDEQRAELKAMGEKRRAHREERLDRKMQRLESRRQEGNEEV